MIIDAVRGEKTSSESMASGSFTLHWNLLYKYLH